MSSKKKGFLWKLKFYSVALVIFLPSLYVADLLINVKTREVIAREWLLPLDTGTRRDWNSAIITPTGGFLARRVASDQLKEHLHTGVDLQNGGEGGARGGQGEKVYAAAWGKVIDVKRQGRASRVTIRHLLSNGETVYSSYIHVGGIRVKKGERVSPWKVIAHRFNREEIARYGEDFNHLHFQIHKRRFVPEETISLTNAGEVQRKFYDPEWFFEHHPRTWHLNWHDWILQGKITPWEFLAFLFG